MAFRWLAAALLVLNICYYWYASAEQAVEPAPPAPVVGAQRLVLLSELGNAQQASEVSELAVGATGAGGSGVTAANSGERKCWELGPLDQRMQADLADLFQRISLPLRSFTREQVDATDFWVYLAVRTAEERDEYQRQLREMEVEHYVIGGGELEGNISLGLFTNRERAQVVANPLQDRKMPVVIHSRQRRQSQTWVRLDSDDAGALGWSTDLSDLSLWPRPAILEVECEEGKPGAGG